MVEAPDTTSGNVYASSVDTSNKFRLTLSEPFLGTSIIPVLTDTGAVATAIASAGHSATAPATSTTEYAKAATSKDYLELVKETVATANTDSLVSGSDLFVSGCPITSMQNQFKMATDQGYLEIFHTECLIDFFGAAQGGSDAIANLPIFRRSDDPSNQNVYKTTADTAVTASTGYCFARGDTKVYPCSYYGSTDGTPATTLQGTTSATNPGKVLFTAGSVPSPNPHPYMFVDNLGP